MSSSIYRMKAYRLRRGDIDMNDGYFEEKLKRLYEYVHEVIRSH